MEYFGISFVQFFLSFSILALVSIWLFGGKSRKPNKVTKSLKKSFGILELFQFAYLAFKTPRIIGKQRESRYLSIYNKFASSKSGYAKEPLPVKILGKTCMQLFFDYESIHKINTCDAFNDRSYDALLEVYSGGKPAGIVMNNTKYHWGELKRYTMKKLKQLGLGTKNVMAEILADLLPELIERIESLQKKSNNRIQVNGLFSVTVLNVISCIASGRKHSEHDRDFIESFNLLIEAQKIHTLRLLGIAVTGKVWGLRELFGYTAICNNRNRGVHLIQNNINDRKSLGHYKDNPENFVDFFLQEIDKHKNDAHYKNIYCEHQLVTIIQDLFLAGMETTSKFLETFMMFMCLYPDVQNKIHQEIDSVVGKIAFPISYEYKSRMNYTVATIHEVHRFANVLPIVPRMATRDIEIGGRHLKKGDLVASVMFCVRLDDSYWKEPSVFCPDRFLDDKGQIIPERVDRMLIFGTGGRMCIGENITNVVSFTLAVGLLQKYTLRQQDETEILSVNEYFAPNIGPHPFHISFFER